MSQIMKGLFVAVVLSAMYAVGGEAVRADGAYDCCGYGGSNGCRYLDSANACDGTGDCSGTHPNCCPKKCNDPEIEG